MDFMNGENIIIEDEPRGFDHARNCACDYCLQYWDEDSEDSDFDEEYANMPDCEVCGGEFWNGGTSCFCFEDNSEIY